MGGYHGPVWNPRCKHGTSLYQRCGTCDAEREEEARLEEERVQGPAYVIRQAIRRRRRWFDGCAFCPALPDLVQWSAHQPDCPFVVALGEARIAYGLHLVAVSEGWDRSPHLTNKEGSKSR